MNGVRQPILDDVAALHWSFFVRPGGWRGSWPADRRSPGAWPAAIGADLALKQGGTVRRIALLPAHP